MNQDLNIGTIKTKVAGLVAKFSRHFSFAVILLILFVYIFTVWRISQLASAEPSPEDQSSSEITSVPKVDQGAINQVLKLENTSPQVHSLFNAARNNPFGE